MHAAARCPMVSCSYLKLENYDHDKVNIVDENNECETFHALKYEMAAKLNYC